MSWVVKGPTQNMRITNRPSRGSELLAELEVCYEATRQVSNVGRSTSNWVKRDLRLHPASRLMQIL